jgi:hypothetical protein
MASTTSGGYRALMRLVCVGFDPEPFEAVIEEGERVTVERDEHGRGYWLTPDDAESVLFLGEVEGWLVTDDEWRANVEQDRAAGIAIPSEWSVRL